MTTFIKTLFFGIIVFAAAVFLCGLAGWPMENSVMIVSVVGAGYFLYDRRWGIPRRQDRSIKRFAARTACEIETFFGGVAVENEEERAFVATCRRIIAEMGGVPEDSIRPDDTFAETLAELPFWDSLDLSEYLITLEEATGFDFDVESIQKQITARFNQSNYTVTVFLTELLAVRRDAVKQKPEMESTQK